MDSKKEITVKIDPDLEEIIPIFFEGVREEIGKTRQAVEQGDFKSAFKAGHNLKGSGGGYGFDVISRIGARIEEAGKSKDLSRVGQELDDLESYIKSVRVTYG